MDFDRVYELENAGIDAFEFSLMDDDEKAEALQDAGLDPDDFDGVEFDSSFDAWSNLQDHGHSLSSLEYMDVDEKREALSDAGLDPDDYEKVPTYSPSFRSAAPHVDPPRVYHFCGVTFRESPQRYSYLADGMDLSVGDYVFVPTGPENIPTFARVASIGDYTAENAPYPIEKTKAVLYKAAAYEIAEHTMKPGYPVPGPQHVEAAKPSSVTKSSKYTDQVPPQTETPKKRRSRLPWLAAAAAGVLVVMLYARYSADSSPAISTPSPSPYRASSYRSSGSSTCSPTYSSTPTCPPVNRERAMTKEQAERLSGTGYHGTRPNSPAEGTELSAAQVRCKNCGYHSDNGLNSLCDYCSWMEDYGGGLPTAKAPDVTPRPTPKPTPRPTPKPSATPKKSDPYHASDYSHPDDFYYDYYDDFWDYEDAEDYWERHH